MKNVKLAFGYEGGDGKIHRNVRIERRATGADLFRIADDGDGEKPTQFNLQLLQGAITKFGSLIMPVPLSVLLSLKSPDRRRLIAANNEFLKETSAGRKTEKLSVSKVKLAFGFEKNGQTFDVVEFGRLLTGYDELEADDLPGWRQACFLLGKQIVRLSQSTGEGICEGEVTPEMFASLDAGDIFLLSGANAEWLDSFRPDEGGEVQGAAGGASGLPTQAHGDERGGDTAASAGA